MPQRAPAHPRAREGLDGFSRIDLSADRRKQAGRDIGKPTSVTLSKIFNLGEPQSPRLQDGSNDTHVLG